MGRKTFLILVVVSVVGGLVGVAMADILGESPQSKQVLLSSVAQEFVPEGNWSGTNWQASGPIEILAMPVIVSEESWMKEYGND